MKKKIVLIVMLLIVIVLSIKFTPRKIDLNYIAVEYNTNNLSKSTNTNLIINGYIYDLPLAGTKFVGKITIGNYTYTEHYELEDIKFDKSKSSLLIYYGYENGIAKTYVPGVLYYDKSFKKFCLQKSNDNMQEEIYICAPANTVNEAIQIKKLIMR